jgi:hypothetical protein
MINENEVVILLLVELWLWDMGCIEYKNIYPLHRIYAIGLKDKKMIRVLFKYNMYKYIYQPQPQPQPQPPSNPQ